jgi:hypothetical protein
MQEIFDLIWLLKRKCNIRHSVRYKTHQHHSVPLIVNVLQDKLMEMCYFQVWSGLNQSTDWATGWTNAGRVPSGELTIPLASSSRLEVGPTQLPIQCERGLFFWGNVVGAWSLSLTLIYFGGKECVQLYSTPTHVFMSWCLVENRNTFTVIWSG